MLNRYKKGQSLVEVMVAVVVILLAFSSIVAVTVTVMKTAASARYRTEAVTAAQYGLAKFKQNLDASCHFGYNSTSAISDINVNGKIVRTTIADLTSNREIPTSLTTDVSSVFVRVVVTVSWNSNTGNSDDGPTDDNTFTLSELVRNE